GVLAASGAEWLVAVLAIVVEIVDGPNLLDDLLDLAGRDDILASAQEALRLVGDGELEIEQDLGSVRITVQPRAGALEIVGEDGVAVFLESIRRAAEVDRHHFFHLTSPARGWFG